MVKILQEERSFTRTYDERPVVMTGPLANVLAVQQQVLDRMASYVGGRGKKGGKDKIGAILRGVQILVVLLPQS